MRLTSGPVARVLGSAISWLLFSFFFTLLFESGRALMALGGSCASGGPYLIETPCPDAVAIFTPLSIFGGLAATAIGLIFARGFGTPLVIWAWPILFVGLGIDFLLAALVPGGLANLVVAIVFIVMGVAPLLFVLRVGAQRLVVGTTNARDRPFLDERGPTSILGLGPARRDAPGEAATAGDWARALGISVPAIALGIWLALAAFGAVVDASAPR